MEVILSFLRVAIYLGLGIINLFVVVIYWKSDEKNKNKLISSFVNYTVSLTIFFFALGFTVMFRNVNLDLYLLFTRHFYIVGIPPLFFGYRFVNELFKSNNR